VRNDVAQARLGYLTRVHWWAMQGVGEEDVPTPPSV
jgi:hypothetical protein